MLSSRAEVASRILMLQRLLGLRRLLVVLLMMLLVILLAWVRVYRLLAADRGGRSDPVLRLLLLLLLL